MILFYFINKVYLLHEILVICKKMSIMVKWFQCIRTGNGGGVQLKKYNAIKS